MYYSRVVMGRIDPNKKDEDETLALFMNDIIPAAREQKGFRGANFYINPKTGQFISTTIWKTEEDMIASDKSGYLQAQLDKVAGFFTEQPVIEYYHVLY